MADYVELELGPSAGTNELGLSAFRTMEDRLRIELTNVEEDIGRVLVLVGHTPRVHFSHNSPTPPYMKLLTADM